MLEAKLIPERFRLKAMKALQTQICSQQLCMACYGGRADIVGKRYWIDYHFLKESLRLRFWSEMEFACLFTSWQDLREYLWH
jgi:hypothetical protein